ncbi:hypothetical protein N7494_001276 [Penicillium frequentans]|uniref:Uncharacterized protein n=1 Tax=Penicillium frequentans TaxID=3151616 RepID=A0AAD6D7Q7_9EURO|nr:hypothetical protein N7494_001276 [Penicillium glabrum]
MSIRVCLLGAFSYTTTKHPEGTTLIKTIDADQQDIMQYSGVHPLTLPRQEQGKELTRKAVLVGIIIATGRALNSSWRGMFYRTGSKKAVAVAIPKFRGNEAHVHFIPGIVGMTRTDRERALPSYADCVVK